MNLTWIAAALVPRDVAPHPNFQSNEVVRPANLLAAVAQHRLSEYEDLHRRCIVTGPASLAAAAELAGVDAARRSLMVGHQLVAAEELAAMTTDAGLDLACRSALALFGAVAFAELDRVGDAIGMLEAVDSRAKRSRGPDARLVRAVLLQQLALRRHEAGLDSSSQARVALDLAKSVRPAELSSFPLSKSVRWRSPKTMRIVANAVRDTADAHLANLDRAGITTNWQRFVRAPATDLNLRVRAASDRTYAGFLKETFERSAHSTKQTIRMRDSTETGMCSALLSFELLGAGPEARSRRSELGRLRFIRRDELGLEWAVRDSLRLFRQAEDGESLALVLRFARTQGPIVAVREAASQICENRLPSQLTELDLQVLGSASSLLSVEEASSALDALLSDDFRLLMPPSRWIAPSQIAETVWSTAAALAEPSGRSDEVAAHLISASKDLEASDELGELALVRAVARLDWETVSAEAKDEWWRWLASDQGRDRLRRRLAGSVWPDVLVEADESPILKAAEQLNRYFRTGTALDLQFLPIAEQAVKERLEAVRSSAGRGVRTLGRIAVADVAAGLALDGGIGSLWPPLMDLLLDARVDADEKQAALDRIASSASSVPDDVRMRLGDNLSAVLEAQSRDFFGNRVLDPFPAGLRCVAALGLVDRVDLMSMVMGLTQQAPPSGAVEAARTLTVLLASDLGGDWSVPLALQLSYHADAVVRAESARALVLLTGRPEVDMRITQLLGDDGLMVPLWVLGGLQSQGRKLGQDVRSKIIELANEHIDHEVRRLAVDVLHLT